MCLKIRCDGKSKNFSKIFGIQFDRLHSVHLVRQLTAPTVLFESVSLSRQHSVRLIRQIGTAQYVHRTWQGMDLGIAGYVYLKKHYAEKRFPVTSNL
jgi:hypothetical protein